MALEDKIPTGYAATAELNKPGKWIGGINGLMVEYAELAADAYLKKTALGKTLTWLLNPGAVERAKERAESRINELLMRHRLRVYHLGMEGDVLITRTENIDQAKEETIGFCKDMSGYLHTIDAGYKFNASICSEPVVGRSTR